MKISISNFNIVLKKQNLVPSQIDLTLIKGLVVDIFKDYTPPIINQFPELLLFIIPESQTSIAFQDNTIIISDNSTQNITHNIDQFISLTKAIMEKTNGDLYAYGFNYSLELELEKNDTSILKGFLNIDAIAKKGLDHGEFLSGAIKILGSENGNVTELNLIPRLDKDYKDTKNIKADYNSHWNATALPDTSILRKSYEDVYKSIEDKLKQLDA